MLWILFQLFSEEEIAQKDDLRLKLEATWNILYFALM